MDVEAEKLGLKGTQLEEIIDLKLEPELIEKKDIYLHIT